MVKDHHNGLWGVVAEFIDQTGTNVIKLSDQKMPAKFAAQKVKVTGTLDARTNTIKVSSIEPADGN